MILKNNIDISNREIENIENKVKTYFTESGFKVSGSSNNVMTFKRGSILQNMWTFNPLKWNTIITAELQNNTLDIKAEISTMGQIPTNKEEKLWLTFLNNLEPHLFEQIDFNDINNKELLAVKRNSFGYVLEILKGAILIGIPAMLLALIFDIPQIVTIGAVIGGLIFFFRKFENENKTHPNKK